jgi:hypothetical protein
LVGAAAASIAACFGAAALHTRKNSQHCAGDDICVVSVVRPAPHAVGVAEPPVQYDPLVHAVHCGVLPVR